MTQKRVLFGTDGIRGEANVHPMTVEIALQLGRAIAFMLHEGKMGRPKQGRKRVVIGKDTRLSCYSFEQALAAGICSMGVEVLFVGPLPTPGVAFIVQSMRADAGLVISASHNPFQDNGIKIFGHDGFKLPDTVEHEIEKLILGDALKEVRPRGEQIGRAKRIDDAAARYVVYLKSTLPNTSTLEGMKIVVDCAHGAAYKVAPMVLRELDADVIALGAEPNGLNINLHSGAMHPENLEKWVKSNKADVGFALDGDGDRVVVIDDKGEVLDGDALLALLAIDAQKKGSLKNSTLVSTVMSNVALERCLAPHGVHVERAQVGDRYVVERMREGGFNLGGEQSGHVVMFNHSTTGDGMVAALALLNVILESGKPLSELRKIFKAQPRSVRNVVVAQKKPLAQLAKVSALIAQIEHQLGANGRVLVRYSGTESKVRVLVEGPRQHDTDDLALKLEKALLAELG